MNYTIEQALGTEYAMFYHSAIPVNNLTPVCTLQRVVEVVNNELEYNNRNLLSYEAARLMRANWIYQRLSTEPIRKPVLVHREQNQLVVDCGDTRLMVLNLLPDPGTVSAVVVIPIAQATEYTDWQQIHTNRDLIQATGFGNSAGIALRTGTTGAIEWLEIGDHTTAHHLHDVDQRINMMQRYIDTQEDTFKFSVEWTRSYINWDSYAK